MSAVKERLVTLGAIAGVTFIVAMFWVGLVQTILWARS